MSATRVRTGLLPDVNVLLALAGPGDVRRIPAVTAIGDAESWATTPVTEASFLRLAMNSAVPGGGLNAYEARQVLAGLRAHPRWAFIEDDSTLVEPVIDLSPMVGFRQVTDFHLVNLAARWGLRFATFDATLPRALAPEDRRHVQVLTV